MSHHKLLKTELSILEKCFPKNSDGCFQIIVATHEELVCRFVHSKRATKYNLMCNISVSPARLCVYSEGY